MVAATRSRARFALAAVVVLGLLYLWSTRCDPTPEQLERAARGKPGVLKIEVVDNGGEDDLPFHSLPQLVTVTMRSSSDADRIQDVVDEYARELRSEYVESLTIRLRGVPRGDLVLDRSTKNPDRYVDAFAAVAHVQGAEVVQVGNEFTYDENDEELFLHYATVELGSTNFSRVHEVWDGLQTTLRNDGIGLTVVSDGFRISTDGRDRDREAAQVAGAVAVARRFGLLGADVGSARRLDLSVRAGTDLRAVRRVVRSVAGPEQAGLARISVGQRVDLGAAGGPQRAAARQVVNRIRLDDTFTSAAYRGSELVLRGTDLDRLLVADTFAQQELEGIPGADDPLARDYLPLRVRYLLADGSELVKLPGATIARYLYSFELGRQGWKRISMTAGPSGARLLLRAPAGMSRADARYYAKYHAEGRGEAPLRIVVTWPTTSSRRPLVVTGS